MAVQRSRMAKMDYFTVAAGIEEDFIPAVTAPHQTGIHNIIAPGNYSKFTVVSLLLSPHMSSDL